MYVLIVSVKVKPHKREEFLEEIKGNATATVDEEPGCLRFDVVQDHEDPDRYYFYEVYVDEAGYTAHTQTPHLARWREIAENCLAERKLIHTSMVFSRE